MPKYQNVPIDGVGKVFSATVSVMNDISPEVIYVKVKGKIRPQTRMSDYSQCVCGIKPAFMEAAERVVRSSERFDDRMLCDIEFSEGSLSTGKWSNVKYSLYLKPKKAFTTMDDNVDSSRPLVKMLNTMLIDKFTKSGFEMMEKC